MGRRIGDPFFLSELAQMLIEKDDNVADTLAGVKAHESTAISSLKNGSKKKSSKKKAGGQGTASACKTAPGGMQGQDSDGQDHHARVGVAGEVK